MKIQKFSGALSPASASKGDAEINGKEQKLAFYPRYIFEGNIFVYWKDIYNKKRHGKRDKTLIFYISDKVTESFPPVTEKNDATVFNTDKQDNLTDMSPYQIHFYSTIFPKIL